MKYIIGQNREQVSIFPISIDAAIDKDNEVRIIDLFVDSIDIDKMGFRTDYGENGRPAYHPKDLLKLYIYGYLNKIRSSRALEKECKRNIELIWLLKALVPDHNTISNFRRDNPKAIKNVFRLTVQIAKHFNLIGGKLIAGDSTKLRAQNSKKNNFNKKKIERHLKYIDDKLEQYEQELSIADKDKQETIKKEIDKHNKRKDNYHKLDKELDKTGEHQISTSDPDSRQMITRNNITEVAYNIQTTVDAKCKIPIDYKVTNTNDSNAMGMMLIRAKIILKSNNFTALYDKGYHKGREFKIADVLGVKTMVAIPKTATNAPNTDYNVENFEYDYNNDFYICPQGNKLTSNGNFYNTKNYRFKRYLTPECKNCPVKSDCSKAKYGKAIQRSEYQTYIDKNKERIEQNKQYYRQRQAIVEHPYGTIKRQWGFDHIMTKKYSKRAKADVGFILSAYNIKRIINTIGNKVFIKYLKSLFSSFIQNITKIKAIYSSIDEIWFINLSFYYNLRLSPKYYNFKQNINHNGTC